MVDVDCMIIVTCCLAPSLRLCREDDWVLSRFEKTSVVMPTYLLAFAVANYSYVESSADTGITSTYVSVGGEGGRGGGGCERGGGAWVSFHNGRLTIL